MTLRLNAPVPLWFADLSGSGARPSHRKHALDHGVLVVAAAGDRLHRGGVEPTIDNEAVVDMHADHLAEHDMAVDRLAVGGFHGDDLDQLAFERAGRRLDPRRPGQPPRGRLPARAAPRPGP